MEIYLIIIFIPTILCYFNNYINFKNYFIWISYLFLGMISLMRYNFGADYKNYYKIYNIIATENISIIASIEKGYIILNKVFLFFNADFNLLIGTISLVNLFLIYKTILYLLKNKKMFYICIFSYLSIFSLFFYHLSMVRQSIAISMFFYAIRFIEKKQIFKYILIIAFASFFHKSAIILLPIYYYCNYMKINLKRGSIFIFMLVFFYYSKEKIVNILYFILIKINMLKYIGYISSKKGASIVSFNFIIVVILTGVFIYLLKKEYNKKNKIILKLLLLNNFIYLFSYVTDILILNRIVDYFRIYYIFLLILIVENKSKIGKVIKNKRIYIFIYMLLVTFFFIKTLQNTMEFYKNKDFLYYKNILFNNRK